MKIDGVSAVALVLILSFVISRLTTAILSLSLFLKPWIKWIPDPDREKDKERRTVAERYRQVGYYGIATILAIGLFAGFGHIRLLDALGFTKINKYLDIVLTGVILVAGADRVAEFLNAKDGPAKASTGSDAPGSRRLDVIGTLTLVDPTESNQPAPATSAASRP